MQRDEGRIDPEAWATLHSDTSRPFDKPTKGRRIAVKVINHLGDEVMKVFRVEPLVLCNPWNWELARASGKPRWNERGSMGGTLLFSNSLGELEPVFQACWQRGAYLRGQVRLAISARRRCLSTGRAA